MKVWGRFREGSEKFQERFREGLGRFREGSGKVQGSCRKDPGKIQGRFWEGSGKVQERFNISPDIGNPDVINISSQKGHRGSIRAFKRF